MSDHVPGVLAPGDMLCEREGCRHPADWHRLDDAQNVSPDDPKALFRCIGYDVRSPRSPMASCAAACPQFMPPPEWDAYWESLASDDDQAVG